MFKKISITTVLTCIILIGQVSTFGDLLFSTFMNHKVSSRPPQFTPNDKWFTQRLDHFNPTDRRTWKQRYFLTEKYADGNRNVVFLKIGGESESFGKAMTNGSWIADAKKFKAILFEVEHRFYGMSRPLKDLSDESLVYLTSQQALGDLAFFIEAMNVKYNFSADTKWIVFGGSYAGNLAAWVRQKYPHLVHGAVSSSAPLLAKLDFPEYFGVVADSLRAADGNCPDSIKKAFDQVELLLQDVNGQNRIKELFNLCKDVDISNEIDKSLFFVHAMHIIIEAVQNNHRNQTNTVCGTMTNKSMGSEVERLAAINNWISYPTCLDYKYEKITDMLRNISWDSDVARMDRQWTYQTCTEFGYYQTSAHQPQIFGNSVNLTFYIQRCEDIFGPKYNQAFLEQAVRRTNVLYGGLDIEVNNVVFVHGSLDPWHPLGITETRTNEAPAILIEGTSHCADRFDPSDADSPQLKAARKQIQQLIGIWLNGTGKPDNKVSNIFFS